MDWHLQMSLLLEAVSNPCNVLTPFEEISAAFTAFKNALRDDDFTPCHLRQGHHLLAKRSITNHMQAEAETKRKTIAKELVQYVAIKRT
jgi:hypothetical protein